MVQLCTLDELKAAIGLGLTDVADDTKLQAYIKMASVDIVEWCGIDITVSTITDELADGDDSPLLALARTPILRVAALSINGQAVDSGIVKVYKQYIAFDEGSEYEPRIRSASRIFPRGRRNVKVSYEAGYATVPDGLVQACILQVMHIQNTLNKQGVISETNQVAQATTAYSHVPLAPAVRVICNRYRPQRVAVI